MYVSTELAQQSRASGGAKSFVVNMAVLVERIFYAGRNWLYLKTAPEVQKTAPKVFLVLQKIS